MYDENVCEKPCKEIDTIEKSVNLIIEKVVKMIHCFDSIIDNRIFDRGKIEEGKMPAEPIPNNKIDRIIQDLTIISNRITDFTDIRLRGLDKELAKL
ncbi:MAG: hypothetical protein FJW56_04280 [Actinobacteria bacterium]|nr:hypothetical protein [Actinomycetota bacterium]